MKSLQHSFVDFNRSSILNMTAFFMCYDPIKRMGSLNNNLQQKNHL